MVNSGSSSIILSFARLNRKPRSCCSYIADSDYANKHFNQGNKTQNMLIHSIIHLSSLYRSLSPNNGESLQTEILTDSFSMANMQQPVLH